ncbi:MAG: glycosyltransferase family 9 protein [Dehalococcoidia bacterium]|nr:glycosyltransferase family 9 protein [Dehalococcoidia bacterium]
MLCAVPALRALRAALPDAQVALIGLPWAAVFAARYARYVDEFIEFPGYPGLPEQPPAAHRFPTFLRAMQERRFDLALQLHGSGRITNPLVQLFCARATAGFYAGGDACPDEATFLSYPDQGPERLRLLRLLEFIGVPSAGDELELPLSDADSRELLAVDGCERLDGRPYVCIHPGARHPVRRWAPARFAATADALAARGLAVVLSGSGDERRICDEVARGMRAPALNLAGRTSLGALAALLAGSRMLVCNDTGVSHLADALGTPSVIVFTGSDPERWAPADRARHRVLRGIGVEVGSVLAEADGLLEREALHAR